MSRYQPPSQQPPPNSPRRDGELQRDAFDSGAAPGRGYTVPIQGQRPALPPPRHAGERIWRAVQRYLGLQRGAQTSSRTWWALKIIQGVLTGVPLILLGAALMLARPMLESVACLPGLGPLFLLLGIIVLLWNVLAPVTKTWRVTIPAGEYWVVENRHGDVVQFVPGGLQDLEWRMNVWLRHYASFTRVQAITLLRDVLPAADRRIDVEVTVLLSFQPHNAPPGNYVELRRANHPSQFERMIQRTVHNAVHEAFQRRRFDYDAQLDLLYNPREIGQIALRALRVLGAWGLFPYPDADLPDVIVYGLPSYEGRRSRDAQPGYEYDPAQRRELHGLPPHGDSTPQPQDPQVDAAPDTVPANPNVPGQAGSGDPTHPGTPPNAETDAPRPRRRVQADPEHDADRASEDPMDRRSAAKQKRRNPDEE